MAEVTVQIGGRSYRLGCEDGEEEHLTALAAKVDAEAGKLGRGMGPVSEPRLLLMTALVMADRHADAQRQIVRLEHRVGELERAAAAGPGEAVRAREAEIAAEIERLAERLETVNLGTAGER